MSNPLPKPADKPVKKVIYPLSVCVVKYEALPEKHEGKDPPPPCNGWCRRSITAPDGKLVEEKVFPWLDETKGKKVYIGVHPSSGKPVTAEHLKFDSPYYITQFEKCPKYDDNGQVVRQWFNEDHEAVEPPEDPNKPPKGWTAQIQIAFEYVVGVDSQQWLAEHTFRIAANAVPQLKQGITLMTHIVNNTGSTAQLMHQAVQQEQAQRSQIDLGETGT